MRRSDERGQASAEYVGLIALLALLAAALITLPTTGVIRGLAIGICDAAGFCDGHPGTLEPTTPAQAYVAALELPLAEFLALAASADRDERLDWSEDGCTHVPDGAPTFDFHGACVRHDFAYRNAALTGATAAARAAADERFKADMEASCENENPLDRIDCRALASIYYRGVRSLGEGRFGGE
ncbi:hypothetical protein HJD18_00220 [Thermoleophilia bacterium SCSIO 60948]|nr:hypothetical protein HJD18_00220 [Thermoleophilia bacterium SCSIO 60948]